MRLNYNILWFENDKIAFETKKEFLRDIIEDFQLNFVEPQHEIDDSNIDTIDYSRFDLIIADMNLKKGKKAMQLLDIIRKKQVLTEVLFYSSSGEEAVRNELAKYKIDGAYCSGREADEFEDKAKRVIETLIKKAQDLTNLRGLVMAEVSELDSLMEEIILKYYSDKSISSPEWKLFITRVIKKVQKSIQKKLIEEEIEIKKEKPPAQYIKCNKKCSHVWMRANKISDIINDIDFDSSKKAHTIHEIIKKVDPLNNYSFNDYDKNIIQVRNALAHSKSEIKDGKEVLVTKKFGKIEFSHDSFIEIRKNIKNYHDLFSELYKKINGA